MATGKCNLLKPVDNLTGTFFMFSQYAQDLTKQYTQSSSYRCVPSKYVAMDLDLSGLGSTPAVRLGEILQDYFENACTVWRAQLSSNGDDMSPEHTRTLLFQTLQKYGLMAATESTTMDGDDIISGVSRQIQHIGDINVYSYDTNEDGVGYNEVYVYIPNDAAATDYTLNAAARIQDPQVAYTSDYISGYEGQASYNGLTWLVDGYTDTFTISGSPTDAYGLAHYSDGADDKSTLVPYCLENEVSSDTVRTAVDSFEINAVIVLYDIMSHEQTLYKNVPMGMYFTGKPDGDPVVMSNVVNKFTSNATIYNQGTAYGLRVCSRFTFDPNSTEVISSEASSNDALAEIMPVIGKFNEAIECMTEVVQGQAAMSTAFNNHLAQFRNNKVNVPYVRRVGDKKYWFVNGKNTGAIAEYDFVVTDAMLDEIAQSLAASGVYYTKEQIDTTLENYTTAADVKSAVSGLISRTDVETMLDDLESRLNIYSIGV